MIKTVDGDRLLAQKANISGFNSYFCGRKPIIQDVMTGLPDLAEGSLPNQASESPRADQLVNRSRTATRALA